MCRENVLRGAEVRAQGCVILNRPIFRRRSRHVKQPKTQGSAVTDPTPHIDDDVIAFAGKVFGYARVGEAEALRELLEQGMPANLRNDKGDSLTMLAAYHGHAETVRVLLAHGGDTELGNDRGQMPLGAAAFKGDVGVVTALLDGGAKVDGAGLDGRTALMLAAMFDRVDLVRMLLTGGADPAARDATGFTARDLAEKMNALNTPALLPLAG